MRKGFHAMVNKLQASLAHGIQEDCYRLLLCYLRVRVLPCLGSADYLCMA